MNVLAVEDEKGLPDGNGFQIIETLKRLTATTGVIIMSARNTLEDKLKGLEIGSDDYLTKPFHLSELNARVKSLLRRRQFGGHNEIRFQEIRVVPYTRNVFVNGQPTTLSRKEYDLLLYFLSNIDVVLTKASLAEHLWGDNIDSADSFDIVYSHIKNLRRKLLGKEPPTTFNPSTASAINSVCLETAYQNQPDLPGIFAGYLSVNGRVVLPDYPHGYLRRS